MSRKLIAALLFIVLGILLIICYLFPEKVPQVKVEKRPVSSLESIKATRKLRVSILYDTAKYIGTDKIPNELQIEMLAAFAKDLNVAPEFSIHFTPSGSYKKIINGEIDIASNYMKIAALQSLYFGMIYPFQSEKGKQSLLYPSASLVEKLLNFSIYHQSDSVQYLHGEWTWMLDAHNKEFEQYVKQWAKKYAKSQKYQELKKRFALKTASTKPRKKYRKLRSVGKLTEYKDLIIKESEGSGIDWQLIASIVQQESKFNPDAISPGGAMGLMQLVRATAKLYKVNDPYNPEENLRAGIKLLTQIEKGFDDIEDADERLWFVVAAYNAGSGHINDARALAKKYGKDPDIWEDNVEYYLKLKSEPEYYKDKVVRWGYCRGKHTADFAHEVIDRYYQYKATFPE